MGQFTDLSAKFAEQTALAQDWASADRRREPEWTLRDIETEIAQVADGAHLPPDFPQAYRDAYARRLYNQKSQGLGALWARYTQHRIDGYGETFSSAATHDWLDVVTGAITSWADPAQSGYTINDNRADLRVLGVVVEDLYRDSFPDLPRDQWLERNRLKPGSHLPPLMQFTGNRNWGPHIINGREMYEICGSAIGVMSLPDTYANDPLLWIPVAHEITGHAVLNGVSSRYGAFWKLQDVPEKLEDAVKGVGVSPPRLTASADTWDSLGLDGTEWRDVWGRWIEEAASDVHACLTMGPNFMIGMMAWLSAAKACYPFGPRTEIGRLENVIYLRNGVIAGDHPPDILRPWIVLGALRSLNSPEFGNLDALRQAAEESCEGVTSMLVHEITVGGTYLELELAPLIEDAKTVGAFLIEQRLVLAHVGNYQLEPRRIRDLVGWSAKEQALADGCAAMLANARPPSVPTDAKAQHLLAGAMAVLWSDPRMYDNVSKTLRRIFEQRQPTKSYG